MKYIDEYRGADEAKVACLVGDRDADEVVIVDQRGVVVPELLAERGDDPFGAYRTAAQLATWVERDDWMDLLNAYGRCIRIVRDQTERFEFSPDVDPEPATAALWEAYRSARTQVKPESDVDRLLMALRPMIPAINRFFDDVLVMHEDRALPVLLRSENPL